ncbi:hypothetical protein FRB94_011376 [Tulasnella sp. JGI-2019a]|nr:hypothetical protein FRB94_011376 [Tulasnella sp. JGI-2019a]
MGDLAREIRLGYGGQQEGEGFAPANYIEEQPPNNGYSVRGEKRKKPGDRDQTAKELLNTLPSSGALP